MIVDAPEAAAALSDIERIVQRVKQSAIYRTASAMLMIWGGIVACAYITAYLLPRRAGLIWIIFQLGGLVATGFLSTRKPQEKHYGFDMRTAGALLLFFAFGLLWSVVLGKFGPREMNAFWATLFMFGYAMAGLWFGRAFIALGLGITVLTMAGYFWAGPLFEPYMAVVDGGGLVLCGLLMRRA